MIASLVSRGDYASLNECVYLNQASLGLLSQPVVRAMHGFLDEVARHGNLRMSDADEVAFFENLRDRAARMFHADADRIAIASSASEVLGQIPLLLPSLAGRRIVTVATDFPAVTRPWLRLAARNECELKFVDDDPQSDLTDDLIAALDERTALVAVGCVQYATGTQIDVPRLREATRQAGAQLVIDADVVVSSGYKWLGGHGGAALAVMAPSLLEYVPPLPGWMGAPDPFACVSTQLLLAGSARRYTQSTMSYVSLVGLTAALDQLLSLGHVRVETHARKLSKVLVEKARRHGWQPFRDPSDSSASPHIVSLMRAGAELGETHAALKEARILCSSRGGRVRVSMAPYNDESDIDALLRVLG